jgi:hypothetical protein
MRWRRRPTMRGYRAPRHAASGGTLRAMPMRRNLLDGRHRGGGGSGVDARHDKRPGVGDPPRVGGSAGVTGLSGSYGPALNGKTGVLGRVCMAQPDFFGIVAAVLAVVLLMDIPVLWISGKQVPELLGQLVFAVFGFYFGRAHLASRSDEPREKKGGGAAG